MTYATLPHRVASSVRPARVALALALLLPLAGMPAMAQAPGTFRAQFQIAPSATPAADLQSGRELPRVGLTGWATSSPRSAIGLSFDVSTPTGTGLMPALRQPVTPSVDMGLRWRTQFSRTSRLDLAAWRRQATRPDPLGLIGDPVYGTNVEVQFDDLSAFGFKPAHSAIGLQVNTGGARLKGGNESLLYYRARF